MAYLLALLGAWFGFANPVYHFPPLVLLFPAGLIWLAASADSPLRAARSGWIAGSIAYTAGLYWIVMPVHFYGPLPWILAVPCPILIAMVLGLYTSLFAFIVSWSRRRLSLLSTVVFAALVWVCLEYLRGYLLSGFPWLGLSQAFAPLPAALQSLPFIGAYGLSGVIVLFAGLLTLGGRHKLAWTGAVLILAVLGALGAWRLQEPPRETQGFRAAIVQGNIEQGRKWNPAYQNATVETYIELSRKQLDEGDPQMLIWPETAMPFFLQDSSPLRRKLARFADSNDILLLTGAPGYVSSNGSNQLFNRAYLFGPGGNLLDLYEKEHLVPFGEYVPLHSLLPFLDNLVAGISDFSPGRRTGPMEVGDLAMGGLICYEVIFPGLVQERVEEGSNCLVNISNDAWFGRTSAPRQHLHQAVLRAAEQNRYVLRSTNTGISAVIDPRGRILQSSGLFQQSGLVSPTIFLLHKRTFFSRYFDYIRYAFFGAALLFFLKALLTRPRTPREAKWIFRR
jgi:apolipoprotein N-acyltransferase